MQSQCKRLGFALYVLTLCYSFFASAQTPVRDLEKYFAELESGKDIPIPISVLLDRSSDQKLFKLLTAMRVDASPLVRQRNYEIAARIGERANDFRLRKSVIEWLSQGVVDKHPRVYSGAITSLRYFPLSDFTGLAKERIALGFADGIFDPDLARIAAALKIEQVRLPIQKAASQERDPAKAWGFQLALARWGDEVGVEQILKACSERKVDDQTVDYFIAGLIYTRQKLVFKYLEKIIFSEQKGCRSPNPNLSQKILCGYRLMEMLAPVIIDFPVRVDDFGDLDHPDYEQALLEVRQWIEEHPDYRIRADTF